MAVVLGPAVLVAQVAPQATAPPSPPKPKAKKIYTEDDLKKLRGRISVLGDSRPKDPPPAKQDDLSSSPAEEEFEAGVKGKPKAPAPPKMPEDCPSARWARFVGAATSRQGLGMPEEFWHGRLFGNFHCIENVGPDRVAEAMPGDYTMDDGSRHKIAVVRNRTLPDPESIVFAHKNGEMMVLVWKGRPYILHGYDTVRHLNQPNVGAWAPGAPSTIRIQSQIQLKTLRLLDPVAGEFATFDSSVDKVSDISFSFYVYVTPR